MLEWTRCFQVPAPIASRVATGNDYVDYGARTQPLKLSLDGEADDGAAGEGDNIGTDVESVIGGSGDDSITGSPEGNALWGSAGDDTINGRDGADWLNGGAGTDTADYSLRVKPVSLSLDDTSNDGEEGENDVLAADFERLLGGSASDTLIGNSGAERLEGGDGDDTLDGNRGIDVVRGDDGADIIGSRDLLADDIKCGDGKDWVLGEVLDLILKKECEKRLLI